MVSLPIDLVSHPKIPVSLRCETSETGGSVSLFREKKFRYVSLQFRFEAKFGDTLLPPPPATEPWVASKLTPGPGKGERGRRGEGGEASPG